MQLYMLCLEILVITSVEQVADYDVRSFIASSTDGKDFGKLQPVVDELLAMSEGVDLSDPQAQQAFRSKVEVLFSTRLPLTCLCSIPLMSASVTLAAGNTSVSRGSLTRLASVPQQLRNG